MATLEAIEAKLTDIDTRLIEVENYRNPLSVVGRLENAMIQIEELTQKINSLDAEQKTYKIKPGFVKIK